MGDFDLEIEKSTETGPVLIPTSFRGVLFEEKMHRRTR